MKKLAMFVAIFLMAVAAIGQNLLGFRPVMIVPDTSYNFPMQMKAGDLVFVTSTQTMYQLSVGVGIAKNMNWVLASSARYNNANLTTFNNHSSTYFLDTATAQTCHGTKGFFDPVSMYSTLAVTGATTMGSTLGVTGTSSLAGVTGTKFRALDSLLVGPTKLYRGTTTAAMWCDDTIHSILGFKTGVAGGGDFGVLAVSGTSALANVTATKVRALDSLLVGPSKLYRGTTATALWCDDTLHSVLGFKTGVGGEMRSNAIIATTTLGVGSQTATQNHVNNILFNNSATATDTLFGPVTKASSKFIVGTTPITESTGKVAADSVSVKRIVVSDTLQGVVLYSAAGVKYRLRVTATGNLTLIAVP